MKCRPGEQNLLRQVLKVRMTAESCLLRAPRSQTTSRMTSASVGNAANAYQRLVVARPLFPLFAVRRECGVPLPLMRLLTCSGWRQPTPAEPRQCSLDDIQLRTSSLFPEWPPVTIPKLHIRFGSHDGRRREATYRCAIP